MPQVLPSDLPTETEGNSFLDTPSPETADPIIIRDLLLENKTAIEDLQLYPSKQKGPSMIRVVESCETELEPNQIRWIRKTIEENWEHTRLVNAPLLETADVPEFPSKESVFKSILKQVTREQAAYMMEEGISPFGFQMKLMIPKAQFALLVKKLLTGQPLNTKELDAAWIDSISDKLARKFQDKEFPEEISWRWEFLQNAQTFPREKVIPTLIKEREVGMGRERSTGLPLERAKRKRAKGIRGMDRFSLVALLANGLFLGHPLHPPYEGTPFDETGRLKKGFHQETVLDEEGWFTGKWSDSPKTYEYLVAYALIIAQKYQESKDDVEKDLMEMEDYVNGCSTTSIYRDSIDGPIEN